MTRRRKIVRMIVEVSVPHWLSAYDARREVRTLINHQSHFGHRQSFAGEEIGPDNFRAVSVSPDGRVS